MTTLLVVSVGLLACTRTGLVLGASPTAWSATELPDVEYRLLGPDEIYPRGVPDLDYRLDATVVYARKTAWTEARALRQIRKTASIFAPCGIELGDIDLVRLSLAPALRRLDASTSATASGVPTSVAEFSKRIPQGARYPMAFLIGRVVGTESLAISYRALDQDGPTAPYFDTAWIGYKAHWMQRRDDLYSPLAHEFAHLLCRCGHTASATGHLLQSARNFLSSTVLPEHCRAFMASPFVLRNY